MIFIEWLVSVGGNMDYNNRKNLQKYLLPKKGSNGRKLVMPFIFKCCWVMSMAAFFILNLSSGRKISLLGCLATVTLTASFMIKSKEAFNSIKYFPKPVYVVTSLLICSALACNFYSAFGNSSKMGRIVAPLGWKGQQMVLVLSIMGGAIAMPIVTVGLSHFIGIGLRDFSKAESLLNDNAKALTVGRAFALLTGIYLVGISAILRANVNYVDDIGRVADGYRGWENFSRFISNGLSTLMHTDNYITDISPMTQLLAIVCAQKLPAHNKFGGVVLTGYCL